MLSSKIVDLQFNQATNMSLFKLKPLYTKMFPGQEFDQKHLAVDIIGKYPALALANFEGKLRLFLINKSRDAHLQSIYQNQFETGIIAVQFVQHPDESIRQSTLGVLFFKKFAFITFQATGDSYEAKIMNVTVEPSFGICGSPLSVMTLNSSIQVINPRQIHKIKVADPIYPFASQLSRLYFMDGEQLVQMEGDNEQWRIIVGRVRQLFVISSTVIVIGERALWEVNQAKIIKTKVMEDDISCGALSFKASKYQNNYNILVANISAQLFVYSSDYELLWAIKLQYVPIKLIICQHADLHGLLVLLSDEGCLQVGYSGVEVPQHVVEPISEKIDYSVVEAETQSFLEMGSKDKKVEAKTQERISLEGGYKLYFSQVQKSFENHDEKSRLFQIDSRLVKCQLVCEITSFQNLRNFRIQLNVPYNLYCKEQVQDLRVAKNKDKLTFQLFASSESFPYEKDLTVVVRYQNNEQKGPPFVKSQAISIPLGLQCLINGFETKNSFQNKIIVKSSLELPAFNSIFPELIPQSSPQQRKYVKFILANGVECSISYNKSFNKAKIESQYYSGLCYIISQFSGRVRQYSRQKAQNIELSVQIPLQEFFGIMKQHFEHRLSWKQAFKEVEIKSEEFRNTQKKLLVKMKQKMSNLGSVDKLLEYNFHRLMESATLYQQATRKMEIINHNLCVAIKLIIQLLFIRSKPSEKARNIALGILGYQKQSLQRGWQDKVYANSAHFLNKKYNKGDQITFQQLQKIPLYVISKVNNGDWS